MYARHSAAGHGWRRIAAVGALVLAGAMVAAIAGCADDGGPVESAEGGVQPDVIAGLEWDPDAVAAIAPGLVGWRSPNDDAPGALVALSEEASAVVLWESPPPAEAWVQLTAVRPDGRAMVGVVSTSEGGGEPIEQTVVFGEDGSVDAIALPEGFGGARAAFVGDNIVLAAYHLTQDDIEDRLGVVSPDGQWADIEISGDLPSYQFIDAVVALPDSETVGLVLKLPGGTGDRDDDALVLGTLSGRTLDVWAGPLYDDALPGARALRDGEGVSFVQTWNMADGAWAPILVRAEWDGTSWIETALTAPGDIAVAVEAGEQLAVGAQGTYWVRTSVDPEYVGESTLLSVSAAGDGPAHTGIDVTDVSWFEWIAPSAE